MNCDCIKELEQAVMEKLTDTPRYKKPVKEVSLSGVAFPFNRSLNSLGLCTASTMEITLEGQKKKEKMTMMHSYCPFCGVSQKPAENKQEQAKAAA